jgi:hypothetical protein
MVMGGPTRPERHTWRHWFGAADGDRAVRDALLACDPWASPARVAATYRKMHGGRRPSRERPYVYNRFEILAVAMYLQGLQSSRRVV